MERQAPHAYAARLADGLTRRGPRELTDEQRYDEKVLLGVRLVDGLPIGDLGATGGRRGGLIAEGLVDATAARAVSGWC